MGRYVKGAHNALCSYCGFKYKSYQLRKDWKNNLACPADYEPKHPQLTLRPHTDRQAVKDARPRPAQTVTIPQLKNSDLV